MINILIRNEPYMFICRYLSVNVYLQMFICKCLSLNLSKLLSEWSVVCFYWSYKYIILKIQLLWRFREKCQCLVFLIETYLYLQRCLFLNTVLIVYLYCFIYVYQLKTIKYVYITDFSLYIFEPMFVLSLFLILSVNKCSLGPGYPSEFEVINFPNFVFSELWYKYISFIVTCKQHRICIQ